MDMDGVTRVDDGVTAVELGAMIEEIAVVNCMVDSEAAIKSEHVKVYTSRDCSTTAHRIALQQKVSTVILGYMQLWQYMIEEYLQ